MHREDNSRFLLYIEPKKEEKLSEPIKDELVKIVEKAIANSKSGTANYSDLDNDGGKFREGSAYKGTHSTECGERSDNEDYLLPNGMITNSLAPFYLRWYRDSIPATEMKKLEALKEYYGDSKIHDALEDVLINVQEIDWKKIQADEENSYKKQEIEYKRAAKEETERVEKMECPCCESTEKRRHHRTENNGIIGPGYFSHTVDDYYICEGCGVHYTDLNKKEIKPPERSGLFGNTL